MECSSQLQFVLSSLYANAHGFQYCAPTSSVSLERRDSLCFNLLTTSQTPLIINIYCLCSCPNLKYQRFEFEHYSNFQQTVNLKIPFCKTSLENQMTARTNVVNLPIIWWPLYNSVYSKFGQFSIAFFMASIIKLNSDFKN